MDTFTFTMKIVIVVKLTFKIMMMKVTITIILMVTLMMTLMTLAIIMTPMIILTLSRLPAELEGGERNLGGRHEYPVIHYNVLIKMMFSVKIVMTLTIMMSSFL